MSFPAITVNGILISKDLRLQNFAQICLFGEINVLMKLIHFTKNIQKQGNVGHMKKAKQNLLINSIVQAMNFSVQNLKCA